MTTKLFTKTQLQQVLRDLRKAGYIVTLENNKYEVFIDGGINDTPVLVALRGNRGFLVRYDARLLTEA